MLALNITSASIGASAVIAQPDARTLVLANLNFVEVFSASLASFQSILSFTCSNCMLQDVPRAIYELRELRECHLPDNKLEKLPTQFLDSQIELLDLTANRFAQVPDMIWRMRTLTTLDLTRNLVASCLNPVLSSEPLNASLTTLVLDENPIATLVCSLPNLESISLQRIPSLRALPNLIFQLPKLTRVVLSGNPQLVLTVVNQVSLSITELHLASCELVSAPVQLVEAMPELQQLDLSWNRIRTLDATSKSVVSKLRVLNLDGNELTNMSAVAAFAAASPALMALHVAANKFSACNLSNAQSAIEIFNVSSNALRDCDIALPKLRVIDLSANHLRAVPTSVFALPALDELYLTGNPIGPWTLSTDEFAFLATLSQLHIQQSAFASCAIADQQSLHDYKVCVQPSVRSPLPPSTERPSNASTNDNNATAIPTTKTARSGKYQVAYIFASFGIALVIAAIVVRLVQRKREREQRSSKLPELMRSPAGSIAFLESPTRFGNDNDDAAFPGIAYAAVTRDDDGVAAAVEASASSSSSLDTTGSCRSNVSNLSRSVFTSDIRALGSDDAVWVDDELTAWRVDYDAVQLETCLATSSSAFIDVWAATYRLDTVAVKRLTPRKRLFEQQQHVATVDPVVMGKFLMEIKVLSRLNHPRIVTFYGVAWTLDATILCVMEYMPQQDLGSFLYRQRSSARAPHAWRDRTFGIALDVLEALAYIHALDPPLVHCDLKSRNVLLDNALQAKLTDFGISKYLRNEPPPLPSVSESVSVSRPTAPATRRDDTEASSSSCGSSSSNNDDVAMDEVRHLLSQTSGSIRWTAPEVLLAYTHYSEAVDVYAFGVLLCELDTQQLPYGNVRRARDGRPLSDAAIRTRVAKGELRPTLSPQCPAPVRDLALRCLAFDPRARPSSRALTYELRRAATAVLTRPSVVGTAAAHESRCSDSSSSSAVSSTETDWSNRTIELKGNRRRAGRS